MKKTKYIVNENVELDEKNKVPIANENVNALDEPNTDKNNEKNNSTKEQKSIN